MNKNVIYWVGVNGEEIFIIIRPTGTLGNITADCNQKCFSFFGKIGGKFELKELGRLSFLNMNKMREIIDEKLDNNFRAISKIDFESTYRDIYEALRLALLHEILTNE